MAEQQIYCQANQYTSLSYAINPGGSQDAVRLNPTGSFGSALACTLGDGSASKWPYYYWACHRSMLWWDLTSYSSPGIILSAKIRTRTNYISSVPYGSQADKQLLALHDGGDVPTYADFSTDDYGKWLNNTTVLGAGYGSEYTYFSGYAFFIYLNNAGIQHLNWGGITSFVFRCDKDVYNLSTHAFFSVTGASGSTGRPMLILTLIDLPYIPFKGMFIRGNEIQAVFGSPADNVSRVYRSPDFGTTWYPISGCNDVGTVDVGFDTNDPQKTFVGGEGKLYKFDHADGEVYNLVEGATIVGTTTEIDVDKDSEIALIGTTSKLYKTTHWGDNAYELLDHPVSALAIGGLETVAYSAPPTSGYILKVNGDSDVYYKSGFFGWSPSPTKANGSYWMNLLAQDADWNPGGTWGYYENGAFLVNDMTSLIQAYFTFENLTSAQSSTLTTRGITEVRVRNYAGRSGYPYGDIEPKLKTHGTYYTAGVRGLQSGDMQLYSAVSVKNPNTGVDWTATEINDLIGGCHAGDVASFGAAYLDMVYAEILYEGGGTKSIGNAPLERESSVSCANTIISVARPAPVTGTVQTIQLYLATAVTACRVGVFYNVSGNNYSTRAWHDVGALDAGYHSVTVNLSVTAGDVIGIYADGSVEADFGVSASLDGYKQSVPGGNQIPATSVEFGAATARVISLRGIIFS